MTEDRIQNTEDKTGAGRDRLGRFTLRATVYCLLATAYFLCSGCNIIGVVASRVSPEPTIPAQFAPAKASTVVLVENYNNPASLRLEADAIARHLSEELKLHDVAPMVDQGDVDALRQKGAAAYRQMPLDAIGRAVTAKQIVYVDLERFDISHALASELLGGQAEARVRVVDDAGAVLWPVDSAGGYPVSVKIQPQPVPTGAGDVAVRRQLHAALADKVARLFYAWKSESSDGAEERFN